MLNLPPFVWFVLQDEVFGSAYAAAAYLSSVLKFPMDKRVYVIGMSGLEDELRSEGICFVGGTVSRHFMRHFLNAHLICRRRILQITRSLRPARYHLILRLAPCWLVSTRPSITRSCRAHSATSIRTLNAYFLPRTTTLRSHRRTVCCPAQAPSSHLLSPRWGPIDQSQQSENPTARC